MHPPGDLIYLSDRKLRDLAQHFGIKGSRYETTVLVQGSGAATLPLAPGTSLSASIAARAERIDHDQARRTRARLLDRVIAALENEGPLPHLDRHAGPPPTTADLGQGCWFRFDRDLRFGVGAADSDHSVKALVFVDHCAIEQDDGVTPGLLMTGAPHHLQDPYSYDSPDAVSGARSGSGTNELFCWLRDAHRTFETDPLSGLGTPTSSLFLTNPVASLPSVALSMYELFARDDWLAPAPSFPDIKRPARCEGIGIASLVVSSDEATVVMGSPLYVRVAAPPSGNAPALFAPRRGFLRRILGRAG
jgi:hypothetical protein